jgi:type I restriction enzyme M protein
MKLTEMQKKEIEFVINNSNIKAVEKFDVEKRIIKYSSKIKSSRDITVISGDEEIARAFLITELTNIYGYKMDNIELETIYTAGRPHTNTSRIDLIVRDNNKAAFLFVEIKSPEAFATDDIEQDIEEQLYKVSGMEKVEGHDTKYLVLYSISFDNNHIKDDCIVIDKEKFSSFNEWKEERIYGDEIPDHYGRTRKKPYAKNTEKDLEKEFTNEVLNRLQSDLHNVLWGGGSTDDNEIFSSLTNIILAKIQDEDETKSGDQYKFQSISYENEFEETYESNEELFDRINELYRRALANRLNIDDVSVINKSYVIDQNKFSLNKLKYTVQKLEKYSFIAGKNSLSGKDILGDFFEGIIRNGFKQSKGQFFTPINVVKFMLWAVQADKLAIDLINTENRLPYFMDCSAGSGTFLIEYMKFITQNIKYRFNDRLNSSYSINTKLEDWFYPDNRENKWAKEYIYGTELNFNLGTAIKVNMILHGDGSSNIFVGEKKGDGLLPFNMYTKTTLPNLLNNSTNTPCYPKEVNENFDLILTNPPFSVDLDNDTKKGVKNSFIFGDKKNSENLFIERYYQLLREKGRLAVILPESVFDTSENKYIRLFLYKYFNIKAVVSLPQLTFAPFTNTKTSVLFAQKKTSKEVLEWNDVWKECSETYALLKTRITNLMKVYIDGDDRNKYPSIKKLTELEEKEIITEIVNNKISSLEIEKKTIQEIINNYKDLFVEFTKIDKDLSKEFGFVNATWVFEKLTERINYEIFMGEVDNVGYKRTLKATKIMPNELYRTDSDMNIIVDDGIEESLLDYIRNIRWDV